ncbi:MAG: potassium transporter TrkG, partial [Plesiomonas shigelloides]
VKLLIHPRSVVSLKMSGKPIHDRQGLAVLGFFFLYVMMTMIFIFLLTTFGETLDTAIGSTAGCINNMGIGYGASGSNFSGLKEPSKYVMMLAMLFGRLEIFPFLVLMSPAYWRN